MRLSDFDSGPAPFRIHCYATGSESWSPRGVSATTRWGRCRLLTQFDIDIAPRAMPGSDGGGGGDDCGSRGGDDCGSGGGDASEPEDINIAPLPP